MRLFLALLMSLASGSALAAPAFVYLPKSVDGAETYLPETVEVYTR